jgi:hypothetical protein
MAGIKGQKGGGGARTGSGRKPINQLSDEQAKILHREIKRRAKQEGRSWQALLLDFVFGKDSKLGLPLDMTARERLTALRLLADLAVAKQSEQTVNVNKVLGPTITLPESMPDPAKLIPIDGGRKAVNE